MTIYGFLRLTFAPLFKALFRLEVSSIYRGNGKGMIVISNHCSNLDPIALGLAIEPPLSFMAKIEMFKNPLIASFISACGAFPVQRGGGGRPAIDAAVAQARAGKMVAMFPEGTRSRDGEMAPFKAGAAIIALEAGVPILPVFIQGSFGVLPRGRFFPRWGSRLSVRIGMPIDPAPFLDGPDGIVLLTERCREALEELKS
ncbi:MAG TPA: 1-acyl-sn-glycerol-3-phosphate acyltransferase [Cyanobacteria bacterium UBA8530]|nr:1-acyl-sn-glycerol-3-phosphate acyltransferase [Cyanobacteria bacterium UBA8530]